MIFARQGLIIGGDANLREDKRYFGASVPLTLSKGKMYIKALNPQQGSTQNRINYLPATSSFNTRLSPDYLTHISSTLHHEAHPPSRILRSSSSLSQRHTHRNSPLPNTPLHRNHPPSEPDSALGGPYPGWNPITYDSCAQHKRQY